MNAARLMRVSSYEGARSGSYLLSKYVCESYLEKIQKKEKKAKKPAEQRQLLLEPRSNAKPHAIVSSTKPKAEAPRLMQSCSQQSGE
jgi:hypothetical protein